MHFLRSTRFWIFVFVGLILLSTISMFFMHFNAGGSTAIITQNGQEIQRIDLKKVKTPYTIQIDNPDGGYNLILVEKGQISVSEASCPDKICIQQGKISSSLKPIVCLPNKLMIVIEGPRDANDADSVSG